MKIRSLLTTPGMGGFYYDDHAALRRGVQRDGEIYLGTAITPGFTAARVPAEALLIQLVLEDGTAVCGDAVGVQYAAVGGRDPIFRPHEQADYVRRHLAPMLLRRDILSLKETMIEIEHSSPSEIHSGTLYGLSQAVLNAIAHSKRKLPIEAILDEYPAKLSRKSVAVFAQTGDQRFSNVDKMLMKRVDVLPHGLFKTVEDLGPEAERFIEYVGWVVNRIRVVVNDKHYCPVLHFDVYGNLGRIVHGRIDAVADLLCRVEEIATPHVVRIENPMDCGSVDGQVRFYADLRSHLRRIGSNVQIVADEWCNTIEDMKRHIEAECVDMIQIKMPDLGSLHNSIEAVRLCRNHGVGAYLGGSCTETEISARLSVHVALAAGADQILAKPGMGVDEGLMIIRNEQARVMAVLSEKYAQSGLNARAIHNDTA